jgi:hypothetical protein
MSQFVQGLQSLFGGGSSADKMAKRALVEQRAALAKQREELQVKQARDQGELGRAYRAPRGRRLLLAATGEEGLSKTLG